MKISIAMATYNGAQYIQEQLQSFVDQTRQPDELIITDDCSSDQTEAIVRDFANTAPFTVEFHRNVKNLGYCGNFNTALMKTKGDWVFLSDQDDVWFPEKIAYMLELAKRNPGALVLMNNAELTDEELNAVGLTKIGQIRSAGFSAHDFVMGCCCAVRRELLDICLPIPHGYKGHDNWLVFFAEGLNAKIIDEEVLQYYRRHQNNESQFIANRLYKVHRFDVLLCRIKKLFNPERMQSEIFLTQEELFVEGVKKAISTSSFYQKKLEILYDQASLTLDLKKIRAEIRSKNLFKRIFNVIILCLNKRFSSIYSFRLAIKDVVG